jgi:quercetin dioxygenase-like cupin family protein
MRTMNLFDNLVFHDKDPYAQPLFVDDAGRVLRFTLRPGQKIRLHDAPDSPLYIVVLKGHGMFTGGDNNAERFGPNALLIFDRGENHSVEAVDEELVFVGFLHGAPDAIPGKLGGVLTKHM